jgi:hypothetical protein
VETLVARRRSERARRWEVHIGMYKGIIVLPDNIVNKYTIYLDTLFQYSQE